MSLKLQKIFVFFLSYDTRFTNKQKKIDIKIIVSYILNYISCKRSTWCETGQEEDGTLLKMKIYSLCVFKWDAKQIR